MAKVFSKVLGIGGSKPKDRGPDPSILRAQEQQERRLREEERKERRTAQARENVQAASKQRGGPVTLFSQTGAAGVAADSLG